MLLTALSISATLDVESAKSPMVSSDVVRISQDLAWALHVAEHGS